MWALSESLLIAWAVDDGDAPEDDGFWIGTKA